MSFLDFLQRLAPFSEPEFALKDDAPLFKPVEYKWKDEETIRQRLSERIVASKLLLERRGKRGKFLLPLSVQGTQQNVEGKKKGF